MRIFRAAGNALLWLVALVGVLSALLWGATSLGYVKPLVVISGSMEPKIMTGDLLLDTPHPTSELRVGDVVAIRSEVTGKLISHRVVKVAPKDGHYEVNLKGDANKAQDGETYVVGDTVWRPVLQVPHGGYVVTTLTKRSVAIPLGVTLLALIGLSMTAEPAPRRRSGDETEPCPNVNAPDTKDAVDGAPVDPAPADEAVPYQFPDRIADLTGLSRR
ncbi:signal peptidase I [Cellulomonas alba]|uniref:Signal peptidase I n=1 Tax=Cellulomonas alba TaxID=3053467 RepID=A0ABT7SGX0_9CELL|nr:signal peptidase I [Cellulomonas alba]MDM7855420.1 signal peptidase I [Cellulomonas alba]